MISLGRWLAALIALVVGLAGALIVQGITGSAAAGWAAFALLLAVLVVRFVVWLRAG